MNVNEICSDYKSKGSLNQLTKYLLLLCVHDLFWLLLGKISCIIDTLLYLEPENDKQLQQYPEMTRVV